MSDYDNNDYSFYFQEDSYKYDDISDNKKIKKHIQLDILLYSIVIIGVIPFNMLLGSISDAFTKKVIIYVYVLIFAAIAFYDSYKKIHTHLTLVTKCTQLVNAQCFSVSPVTYISDNRFTYHPAYKYIWNGVKYAASIGKTETKRKKGEVYPIMINPSDPLMIYDPFAQRRKTSVVIAEAVIQTIVLLAIMVFTLVAFQYKTLFN